MSCDCKCEPHKMSCESRAEARQEMKDGTMERIPVRAIAKPDDYDGPSEAQRRKQRPVFSGVLKYFPRAIMEIAHCSWVGNEQHNPGTALHWDRAKSGDEHDALVRHLLKAGTMDTDGVRHSAKVCWRALAALEKELEEADEHKK